MYVHRNAEPLESDMQHDRHLINWLKATFNIEISQSLFGVTEARYHACKGEYDLDVPTCTGPTIYGAALEYAACYDGELFDKLVAIEAGEPQAIEQLRELVGAQHVRLDRKQRLEALAAYERIEAANDKIQKAFRNIARIFDNMANGRGPNDGVEK